MKQTVRDENLVAEINRVSKIMFDDPNDPTSYNYRRKLARPVINWMAIIFRCMFVLGGIAILAYILSILSVSACLILWTCIVSVGLVIFINLKRILICFVQIYQRYAPDSIRNKCRFEPSCSEYMILSLEKYGLFKGANRGINRLKRCNIHNGGFDYP